MCHAASPSVGHLASGRVYSHFHLSQQRVGGESASDCIGDE